MSFPRPRPSPNKLRSQGAQLRFPAAGSPQFWGLHQDLSGGGPDLPGLYGGDGMRRSHFGIVYYSLVSNIYIYNYIYILRWYTMIQDDTRWYKTITVGRLVFPCSTNIQISDEFRVSGPLQGSGVWRFWQEKTEDDDILETLAQFNDSVVLIRSLSKAGCDSAIKPTKKHIYSIHLHLEFRPL